jgi:hypothetical protein
LEAIEKSHHENHKKVNKNEIMLTLSLATDLLYSEGVRAARHLADYDPLQIDVFAQLIELP